VVQIREVARANAAAIASLALAVKSPEIGTPGPGAGHVFASPLGRGKGHDAVMTWHNAGARPFRLLRGDAQNNLAALRRGTLCWQRDHIRSAGCEYRRDCGGVKAIDKDGNESLISVYVTPRYKQPKIATY
jgi:hypothetical protein